MRLPAARERELHHLGEAARDQHRARVVAEAEAVGSAGGDRDDVLDRAAALDAGDVAARVRTHVGCVESRHHVLAHALVRRRDDDAGRQLGGELLREATGPLRNVK